MGVTIINLNKVLFWRRFLLETFAIS